MKKPKKIPMRLCLGCGEMKPKKELVRIVKNKENEIFLDESGKAAGRGAYVCKNIDCFEALKKGRKLNKAFSGEIPNEIYDSLIKELENAE